jgi:glycosyltransferase involved in cell wall biosynthesis
MTGSEGRLDNVVAICALSRPDDIERCLQSLADQTRLPSRIVIVDASAGDETAARIRELQDIIPPVPVNHVTATPGLTRQRNIAVNEAADCDVVHFLDDDVACEPGYLEGIVGGIREGSGRSRLRSGRSHRERVGELALAA